MIGKTSTENLSTYADFLESLGIIQKWQKSSKSENPDLERLASLQIKIVQNHSLMTDNIKDLEKMNSFIRDEKNREILLLKEQLNKFKL
tara:strand:- start:153 stop:419 length:267 start_codon:yes stop_codon:yes gene_type:complete